MAVQRSSVVAVFVLGCVGIGIHLILTRKKKQMHENQVQLSRVMRLFGDDNEDAESVLLPCTNMTEAGKHFEVVKEHIDREIKLSQYCIIGLDCEWRPEKAGEKNRVAVIQIAVGSRVYVLQLLHLEAGAVPAGLRALLAEPRALKVGVGVEEDARRLWRDHGLLVRGAVDLRAAARAAAAAAPPAPAKGKGGGGGGAGRLPGGGGLAGAARALLPGFGSLLEEGKGREQTSNWARRELTDSQVRYAALDALASLRLAHALAPGEDAAGGGGGGGLAAAAAAEGYYARLRVLAGEFDKKSKFQNSPQALGRKQRKGAEGQRTKTRAPDRASPQSNGGPVAPAGGANDFPKRKYRIPTRKKKLYENCRMLAPDGECLTTCGKKKIDWYVSKGLATYDDEDQTTIRLKFEPKGRSKNDIKYHASDKVNRCCACGAGRDYLRHHVVPHCYRQHFPLEMKTHLSHDVVLLCLPCHVDCCKKDQEKMQELGDQYNAPLPGVGGKKVEMDKEAMAIKKKINALLKHRDSMPAAKVEELETSLKQYFQVPALSEEILRHKGEDIEPWIENTNWVSHSKQVIDQVSAQPGGLEGFVVSWRLHFVARMTPRFLPPFWDVHSRVRNSDVDEAGARPQREEGVVDMTELNYYKT